MNKRCGEAALIYRFENCTLDIGRRELRRDGALRPVEPQVFDLLRYLIENRERVVSRDEIFQALWRGRIVSDGVLSTRLNAVRVAIGDSGHEQRLIRTLPKRGVRFVGAVSDDLAFRTHKASANRLATTLADAPAIALIPLANSAGDPVGASLADALTDEIIAALWRHDWLQVVSSQPLTRRTSSIQLPAAQAEQSARYLLQGSVRHSGGRARISIRLSEVQSSAILWAEGLDAGVIGSASGSIVENIQRQVTDHIFAAEALRGRLASAQRTGVWGSIVAAVALMNTREKRKVQAAYRLLRHAVTIDPQCAPAYALLSFIVTLRAHLAWRSRAASQPEALALARQAIAADADDAWGHLALGYATMQVCNQPEQAIEILHHTLRLNPALSMAHYFIALSSVYAGHVDKAFRHADMAEALHTHDLLARGNVGAYDIVRGTASFVSGRHSAGISHTRAALAKNARNAPAYRQLITNAALAGETQLARDALGTLKSLGSDTGMFVRESATIWQDRNNYQKVVGAFRIAGLERVDLE